ncbi:MAG: type II secretion system protein [Geothrix sp.]|uniref:type II secretion system protein n=1 Tax=Geothrix sp. TaxID=1962974 RepID=UPI0017A03821|nr:type II secretion system protein [Geothrix sp.]NWJ42305.1 type II secretion system protein [Geothrix sp.]WIL19727.1 MAG: type II secretion system GspH family protein [Geothrix sp.]
MTPSRSQRGFTMALALAVAVVMGIMLMKAGPLVSAEVQRENEAELIFRGEAIAAAFKLYASKAGRYPMDLDEVMKVRPRILRQKYKDPMTPGGEWEYITQVRPGASGSTDGLPIVGVRSKSTLNSIRIYQNKTLVREWQFTAEQNLLGITDEISKSRGLPKAGNAAEKPVAPKE